MRLKDFDFADLYLCETGEMFFKDVANDLNLPIVWIDESTAEDIFEVHQQVCERGEMENQFFLDHDGIRYRVQRSKTMEGRWYTLRKPMWPLPSLVDLGYPHVLATAFLKFTQRPGLILVAGSTGGGKTTFANALLKEALSKFGGVAVLMEDPPELPMAGKYFDVQGNAIGRCIQVEVENRNYAQALVESLRMHPDIVFMGELRTEEDASEAARMAISGHCIISTIHADSVENAIMSFTKLMQTKDGAEMAKVLVADGLSAVMHQTLVKLPNGGGKRPRGKFLFVGQDASLRAQLRSGKGEQIPSEIARQFARVQNGQLPY